MHCLFPAFPWTILDDLRCIVKVYVPSFQKTRCALTEMPWETVNVSTSIHVETTLYLAQILFARAQPSVQMTISKVGTPSKFGVKRLTFEYLTDYSVFTLNYRLGGQHN